MLKLYISLYCIFKFLEVNFSVLPYSAYILVRCRNKQDLVWLSNISCLGLKYLLNRKKFLFFVNTNRLEVWSLLQNTPWWHANKLRPLDWTWTLVSWLKVLRLTQRYLLFQRLIWSPNFLLCSHHNNNSAQVTTNVNTNQPVFQLTLTKKLLLLTWPQWIVVFYWSPRSNGFRFDKGVIYWFVIE